MVVVVCVALGRRIRGFGSSKLENLGMRSAIYSGNLYKLHYRDSRGNFLLSFGQHKCCVVKLFVQVHCRKRLFL